MGLGMMLSEEVSYHGAYGSLLTNSTWHYKPPAATCVPQQLNISILDKAPLATAVGLVLYCALQKTHICLKC